MKEIELKEKLLEKIKDESGCPLCALVMDHEFSLLADIQYDIVRYESLRKEVAAEGGFCDYHFRQFKKISNYKTSIPLLKAIIESGIHKDIYANINCRLCKEINQFEDELIKQTSSLFYDFNFQEIYKKSNGICVIHLKGIIKNIQNEKLRTAIEQFHNEQIDRFKPMLETMSATESYLDIPFSNRELVNILIQKFAGRKTAGF